MKNVNKVILTAIIATTVAACGSSSNESTTSSKGFQQISPTQVVLDKPTSNLIVKMAQAAGIKSIEEKAREQIEGDVIAFDDLFTYTFDAINCRNDNFLVQAGDVITHRLIASCTYLKDGANIALNRDNSTTLWQGLVAGGLEPKGPVSFRQTLQLKKIVCSGRPVLVQQDGVVTHRLDSSCTAAL